jgi:glycosyltransferase involved in cell wall biosynthesis
VIKQDTGKTVPYVYHGVDHDTFRVYTPERRDETRRKIGWSDKFVITAVSTNVRRKQLPRLIEAVSILRFKYKITDISLYLHTIPFQGYWLDGHNLREITDMFGVSDITIFNGDMKNRNDSVPEEDYTDSEGKWHPGLVSLYNASDLYVNPSQVEGFGLPIAEAMACGLPVLVTKYAAGWEVASPAARGIPVKDWEIHKSATKYANVDVDVLASEILRFKRAGIKDRERMVRLGIERAADFKWETFHKKIVEFAEDSIVAYKERRSKQQEADKVKEAGNESVDLRRGEGEDTPTESHSLIKRSVEDIERQAKAYKARA